MANLPTEAVGMTINSAGHLVPTDHLEHFAFWVRKIKAMIIKKPTKESLAFFTSCIARENSCQVVPADLRNNTFLQEVERVFTLFGILGTPWLVVFIAGQCTEPKHAVLWAAFMKLHYLHKGPHTICMGCIPTFFPKGLPLVESMNCLWDLQILANSEENGNQDMLLGTWGVST